jgi:hypothetical protein
VVTFWHLTCGALSSAAGNLWRNFRKVRWNRMQTRYNFLLAQYRAENTEIRQLEGSTVPRGTMDPTEHHTRTWMPSLKTMTLNILTC